MKLSEQMVVIELWCTNNNYTLTSFMHSPGKPTGTIYAIVIGQKVSFGLVNINKDDKIEFKDMTYENILR